MRYKPRICQERATHFMLTRDRSALWMGMGLGKTSSSLTAVATRLALDGGHKTLVLGPKRVIRDVWPFEVKKWDSLQHLDVTAIDGDAATRRRLLHSPAPIHAVSYDNVPWLLEQLGGAWPYDAVIADECFVRDTPVNTPHGPRAISDLQVGDLVSTIFGPRRVTYVYRKRSDSIYRVTLGNGATLLCTGNHPFWTGDAWTPASLLAGHTVFAAAELPDVWGSVRGVQETRPEREVLREELQFTGYPGEDASGGEKKNISERFGRLAEGAPSLEQGSPVHGGNQGKTAGEQEQSGVYADSRGERPRPDYSREDADAGFERRLGVELCDTNRATSRTRAPLFLQGGFRMGRSADCLGGGRQLAHIPVEKGAGRQEVERLNPTRVVRVEDIQCAGPADVWDIEVEDAHHFFAHGILVHNCSKLKAHDSVRFDGVPARRKIFDTELQLTTALANARHPSYRPKTRDGRFEMVTEARRGLRHILTKTRYWTNLTGTPAPNGLQDQWAQTYLLDRGERLGRTVTDFRNRWFRPGRNGFGYEPLPHAQAEIGAALSDICLTLRAADYMDLPPLIENIVHVPLPDSAKELHARMKADFVMELRAGTITAANAADKSNKMLQLASGFCYLNAEKEWEEVHTAKLEALDSVMEEAAGEPVIVTYQFKADLTRLQLAFPEARLLTTKADEDDWNAGRIPMLLLHPASAGHGLSLQYGGRIMADFSLGWNLEYDQQVIERIGPTRQFQSGFDRPTIRHRLVADGTIDQYVLSVLQGKATTQDALMEFAES